MSCQSCQGNPGNGYCNQCSQFSQSLINAQTQALQSQGAAQQSAYNYYQGQLSQAGLGNYQGITVQSQQGGMILGQIGHMQNPDYEMWLKYAHLEDGELIRKYFDEKQELLKNAEIEAKALLEASRQVAAERETKFYEWLSKYKKHLTPERIEKLKVFL